MFMNKVLREIASTCIKDDGACKDGLGLGGNNILIWIVAIFVIFCCGGKNIIPSTCCDPCAKQQNCCTTAGGGGLGGSWLWIIIVIGILFSGKGVAGLGGRGNVNTNVIKVRTDDNVDDYEDDYVGI